VTTNSSIVLNLLDPVNGHPLQRWEFRDRSVVRIGRSETNDVIIADPVVSRVHVELIARDDGMWGIVSLGRNGTYVDGEPASDSTPVRHGMVLQLGASGPSVELREGQQERSLDTTQATFGSGSLQGLQIDQEMMQAEVQRIADGDRFKDLQKQAQELRKARGDKNPH
jgi:pSer/pThr/pTyr-binding forkhead associated (FHA) protein